MVSPPMTNQPHEAGVPDDGLPAAFITCTSANPDYYVTIKTRTLKDAQRWHDAVLELDRSRRSAPETEALREALQSFVFRITPRAQVVTPSKTQKITRRLRSEMVVELQAMLDRAALTEKNNAQ